MTCPNCKTGFKWDGTATGKETTLNSSNAYVAGDSKDSAVLILTDIFGWKLPNIRLNIYQSEDPGGSLRQGGGSHRLRP